MQRADALRNALPKTAAPFNLLLPPLVTQEGDHREGLVRIETSHGRMARRFEDVRIFQATRPGSHGLPNAPRIDLRRGSLAHFAPTAHSLPRVRMYRRPALIAGVAITPPASRLRASTPNSGPAARTTVSPVLLVK